MVKQKQHKLPIFFWTSLSTLFIFCYYLLAFDKPIFVHLLPIIGFLLILYHPQKGFYLSSAAQIFYFVMQRKSLYLWDMGHLGFLVLSLWIFSRLYAVVLSEKDRSFDDEFLEHKEKINRLNTLIQENNAKVISYEDLIETLKSQKASSMAELKQKCVHLECQIFELSGKLRATNKEHQSLSSKMTGAVQTWQVKAMNHFEVIKKLEKEKNEYILNYPKYSQEKANYVQLRKQFLEKKQVLGHTRKELFHLQTSHAVLKQNLKKLIEEPSDEILALFKLIEKIQEEREILLQDNLALENLLTHFMHKKSEQNSFKKIEAAQMGFQW